MRYLEHRHRMRYPPLVLLAVLCATALTAASDGLQVRSVDGRAFALFAPKGPASAVFFIATDCPISNWYAPTIQQVCRDYAARGVDCTLVYEDLDFGATPVALDAEVRTHLREYRYGSMTATVDRTRAVATRARATVTPVGGARRSCRRDPVSRPHRQRLCRSWQAAPACDLARSARVARRGTGRTPGTSAGDRRAGLLHR